MTFKERCNLIQQKMDKTDVSNTKDNLSAIVTITGEGGGVIYMAISNKKKMLIFNPEPIKKADLQVTMSGETFDSVVEKKLDPMAAFTKGKVKVSGNIIKMFSLTKSLF